MDQCNTDTVAEETNTSIGDLDAVIVGVAEKHESELQEKTVPCSDSVSELHSDDSTKLSPKEDGELSSSRYLFHYLLECLYETRYC